MQKKIFVITSTLLVLLFAGQVFPQQNTKLAQTGFQFLSVNSNGLSAGMAGAVNSLELGSGSLFFNPAGMANMTDVLDITASNNKWIADIQHNAFSLALSPGHGRYGVVGFTAQSVDYGDKFYGTILDGSDKGYADTGDLNPSALAFGVGYAKALTDRFSVGGQVHWVKQDLGSFVVPLTDSTAGEESYNLTVASFDFGTLYKTGFKSLAFGMSVRNFSQEIQYIEESFQLPLIFTLGISMDLMDFLPESSFPQSLLLSVDATHDRAHAEQVLVGLDYKLLNLLSLRGGYITSNDESGLAFGFGVSQFGLALDYAYTPYGLFDNVQRATVRFSF